MRFKCHLDVGGIDAWTFGIGLKGGDHATGC